MWLEKLPNCQIFHQDNAGTDHAGAIIKLDGRDFKGVKQFRFKNMWLRDKDCQVVVLEMAG